MDLVAITENIDEFMVDLSLVFKMAVRMVYL